MYYTPPTFRLLEFAESAELSDPQNLRWLPSWNGPVDEPAQDVTLGWVGKDNQQCLVVTSGRLGRESPSESQLLALMLVLGGNQLDIPSRPDMVEAKALLNRDSLDSSTWERITIQVNGQSQTAHSKLLAGSRIGYVSLSDGLAAFATYALAAEDIRLTFLQDGTIYDHDPLKPHSADEMRGQREVEKRRELLGGPGKESF